MSVDRSYLKSKAAREFKTVKGKVNGLLLIGTYGNA